MKQFTLEYWKDEDWYVYLIANGRRDMQKNH